MPFKMTVVLATPDDLTDEDTVFPLELPDKRAVHRVERGLYNALGTLLRITENELESKTKTFNPEGKRTLVTLTVNIEKDGADWGGYMHRFPNQEPEAVEFLRGLLEGVMAETGHRKRKQKVKKAR